MTSKRLSRFWIPLLAAFLLLGVPTLVEFYTDWLWFGETGYRQVFLRSLSTKAALSGAVWTFVLGFLYLNTRWALRDLGRQEFTIPTAEGPQTIVAEPGGSP